MSAETRSAHDQGADDPDVSTEGFRERIEDKVQEQRYQSHQSQVYQGSVK